LEQLTARALAEGILGEAQARQICPRAVTRPLQLGQQPENEVHDPHMVLALSREDRTHLLAAAARDAAALYAEGTDLTAFDAFSAEDFLDNAGQG
jgi:hypothetical protein